MEREILTANEGMILTDGNIYGRIIYLAENVDPSVFKEITEEEYDKILEQEVEANEDMY